MDSLQKLVKQFLQKASGGIFTNPATISFFVQVFTRNFLFLQASKRWNEIVQVPLWIGQKLFQNTSFRNSTIQRIG